MGHCRKVWNVPVARNLRHRSFRARGAEGHRRAELDGAQMARERKQAALTRLLAGVAACAIFAIAADKPLPNQVENRKLRIEATAITEIKAVTQEAGVH